MSKIDKYLKATEKEFHEKGCVHNAAQMVRWADMTIIPAVSMSKLENACFDYKVAQMIYEYHRQLKL